MVFKEDVKKRTTWTQQDSLGVAEFRGSRAVNTTEFKDKDQKLFQCMGYCEAQIWGEIGIHDVAYAIVLNDKEIPEAFKRNNIPVYEQKKSQSSVGIEKGKLLYNGKSKSSSAKPITPNNSIEQRIKKFKSYSSKSPDELIEIYKKTFLDEKEKESI